MPRRVPRLAWAAPRVAGCGRRSWRVAVLAGLVTLGGLPAGAQGRVGPGVGRVATAALAWPPPPDAARISYAGFVSSELDIGKKTSGLARLRQVLSGTRTNVRLVQRPHDVFVDSRHRLYVTDGLQRSVLVFDPEQRAAREIGTDGPGRLVKPLGLGGGSRDRVYVADQGAKRVVVFDSTGSFVGAMGGDRLLLNPVDVAVDTVAGLVYVADSYLHQVLVFREDGALVRRIGRHEGDLAAKLQRLAAAGSSPRAPEASHLAAGLAADGEDRSMFGHSPKYLPEPRDLTENRGAGPGEFRYPAFLATGRDGTLYVSDGMNFRIQSFDRTGRFLRAFGSLGDGPGAFARPKGVAVDSDGNVHVVDAAFANLQIFSPTGELLLPFGQMGRGPGELWLPLGVFIDRDDHVYVSDRFNNRVQVFTYHRAARPLVNR